MELEFDKEMDALLRKTAESGVVNTASDSHLDADEISMFAENVLPDSSRNRAVSHFAECDRCRTILVNVIELNRESAPAAVPATEISASADSDQSASWLSNLFTARNLAFGFGAMAVLFAGFLGITVIQNMNSGVGEMAMADANEVSAPASSNVASNANFDAGLGSAAENESGFADVDNKSEFNSNAILETSKDAVSGKEKVIRREVSNDDSFVDRSDISGRRQNIPVADAIVADEEADAASELRTEPQQPASQPTVLAAKPAPPPKTVARSAGAARAEKKVEQAKRKRDSNEGADADKSSADTRNRKVGGKTFSRRNGIWYDSEYKGQPTRNLKRGTPEYQGLDAGVRTIANQLEGTVILIWKTKALKIQ